MRRPLSKEHSAALARLHAQRQTGVSVEQVPSDYDEASDAPTERLAASDDEGRGSPTASDADDAEPVRFPPPASRKRVGLAPPPGRRPAKLRRVDGAAPRPPAGAPPKGDKPNNFRVHATQFAGTVPLKDGLTLSVFKSALFAKSVKIERGKVALVREVGKSTGKDYYHCHFYCEAHPADGKFDFRSHVVLDDGTVVNFDTKTPGRYRDGPRGWLTYMQKQVTDADREDPEKWWCNFNVDQWYQEHNHQIRGIVMRATSEKHLFQLALEEMNDRDLNKFLHPMVTIFRGLFDGADSDEVAAPPIEWLSANYDTRLQMVYDYIQRYVRFPGEPEFSPAELGERVPILFVCGDTNQGKTGYLEQALWQCSTISSCSFNPRALAARLPAQRRFPLVLDDLQPGQPGSENLEPYKQWTQRRPWTCPHRYHNVPILEQPPVIIVSNTIPPWMGHPYWQKNALLVDLRGKGPLWQRQPHLPLLPLLPPQRKLQEFYSSRLATCAPRPSGFVSPSLSPPMTPVPSPRPALSVVLPTWSSGPMSCSPPRTPAPTVSPSAATFTVGAPLASACVPFTRTVWTVDATTATDAVVTGAPVPLTMASDFPPYVDPVLWTREDWARYFGNSE